jgi:hypothetical protein
LRLAEWLIEHGIGEDRAMLVEGAHVLATKLHWPGTLAAGALVTAKLISKSAGARRGIAKMDDGTEVLVRNLTAVVTEGAQIQLTVTRAPIAERGRLKRATGKFESAAANAQASGSKNSVDIDIPFAVTLLGADGIRPMARGQFLDDRWDDIWNAASTGTLDFAGGSIIVSTTPAMTVIDIDGEGSPRELSLAAIPAICDALRWFDLGGSIGIDFPTIDSKQDRKSVDSALAAALDDWPHERTAMNGFGFVQIVTRLEGPSLLHRFATSRIGMCARMALRRAEMVTDPGAIEITVHPALEAKILPKWLDELRRRTGRDVRIETNPSLALEAAFAQAVPR